MQKRILILGAGIYQVPLIKQARKMGLYVIVSSIPGAYPGFQYADQIYYENTTSKEKILEIAKKEKIDAILTCGTDVAITTVGYVNSALKLAGVSAEAAERATNKTLMKSAFLAGNVRTAEFFDVSCYDEAVAACCAIGFPVIFKCIDRSGSRGIMRVNSMDQTKFAYEYATSAGSSSHIIVERFLQGTELGLDGFVDGKNSLFLPHEKIVWYNGKSDVPLGHVFPYIEDAAVVEDICTQAQKAVAALGLQHCFFNMDIMLCNGKAYIIEAGARSGATCIPELMGIYCGCNFYEKMLLLALGEPIGEISPVCQPCASKLLVSEKDGVLSSFNVDRLDRNIVSEYVIDYPLGSHVRRFSVGPDRLGHVVVKGSSADEAHKNADQAVFDIGLIIR